jgi:hypothetical protein
MTTYRVGDRFAVVGKEEWGLKPNTTGHEAAAPLALGLLDLSTKELLSELNLRDPDDSDYPDPLPIELWKNPTPPRKEAWRRRT